MPTAGMNILKSTKQPQMTASRSDTLSCQVSLVNGRAGSGNKTRRRITTPDAIRMLKDNATPEALEAGLHALTQQVVNANDYSALLPVYFTLQNKNRPFSLKNYVPFRPMYSKLVPSRTAWRTGRQCSKSTNMCNSGILRLIGIPGFRQLYVLPLFEQVRRFSSNYVKPAIMTSPLRHLFFDQFCEQNVLQKSLSNGSYILFTFCSKEVDRARGIPADAIAFDEAQDIDANFIPIIEESLSASDYRWVSYTFTPKTMDAASAKIWAKSSQQEFVIRCGCGKHNIPALQYDLVNMIQPHGLACAKCSKLLDVHSGEWVPAYPERVSTFDGRHVPQVILPMHCYDKRAWREVLTKQKGYKTAVFLNEVLGEDCDAGAKMIPVEVIRKCSVLPHRNILQEAVNFRNKHTYHMVVLGIDWGGRGVEQDSLTAFVVVGLRNDNKVDIIYAEKVPPAVEDLSEVQRAKVLANTFSVHAVGHDYRGAGMTKDTLLTQAKLPAVTPWSNEPYSTRFFAATRRSATNRIYVSVNRSAVISLFAHEMHNERIRLPQAEDADQNVFLDYNSWYENYISRPDGSNIYHILRSSATPDDIGMASIYGACTAWRRMNAWPQYYKTLTSVGIIDETTLTDAQFEHE